MKIKILQWNIGGGNIRKENSDSALPQSYDHNDLAYIIKVINQYSPDIVTLQETHANNMTVQAGLIAKKLGYEYYINDVYDVSHVDSRFGLGQAIISKFELADHKFELFFDIGGEYIFPDGRKSRLHRKGFSSVAAKIKGRESITVGALHNVPFRAVGIDPNSPKVKKLRDDIEKNILDIEGRCVICGDFNIDSKSLHGFLPNALKRFDEVLTDEPTTPKGRKYDHVLYRDMEFIEKKIDHTVLTDHYPIICEFEI